MTAKAETQDIFVRSHVTPKRPRKPPHAVVGEKWPKRVLVFDTEATMDIKQRSTFGAYRLCELGPAGYLCIEEGLFHDDDLDPAQLDVLRRYVEDPRHLPDSKGRAFPPQLRLKLLGRSEFVERVLWKTLQGGGMVVGFNLPFDLSRLAVHWGAAKHGGWSLALSTRKGRKSGKVEPNPERPRIVVRPLDSKRAFIALGSLRHKEEWPGRGRFLDLRTLGFALRNQTFGLNSACRTFRVQGKTDHHPTGTVTEAEINYCREDVRATLDLLNAMREEFDRHPVALHPDRAYSPASLAEAYLDAMGVAPPGEKFAVPDELHGIAMQAYFGGRTECRIRNHPMPIALLDFTSEFPTVASLLGLWELLTAESLSTEECTDAVRRLLGRVALEDAFKPSCWKELRFFALVEPDGDLLPVRTMFNRRTRSIGLSPLTSKEPVWLAGPDLVAAVLHTGKAPKILRAVRLVPHGRQPGLTPTSLMGAVPVDPVADDFFRLLIEQRAVHKPTHKALADALKGVANAGSYGILVRIDSHRQRKPETVRFHSGERAGEETVSLVESGGRWYFPSLGSLVAAGGRLLLALLERCVMEAGGTYLNCDTDAMCIVGTECGGLVRCPGGPHRTGDGHEAVQALSWRQVDGIAARFESLNPYDRTLVPHLLKIEDVNFEDADPDRPQRQLYGFAIASKRYALFTSKGAELAVVKASAHGLGHLHPPKDGFNSQAGAPEWVVEAWEWIIRTVCGCSAAEPAWLDAPALMQMTHSSPNMLAGQHPEPMTPFTFYFRPHLSGLDGYPAGCSRENAALIIPFTSDQSRWSRLTAVNVRDGKEYRVFMTPDGRQRVVVPESFRIVLRRYREHAEAKALAPDGSPCTADTRGLLQRTPVVARGIRTIGKETDRRAGQGEDESMLESAVQEYGQLHESKKGRMVVAEAALQARIRAVGLREVMRRTGLNQHTVEKVRDGRPVRHGTLERIVKALGWKP